MTRSDRHKSTEPPFLSVDDAEIVHGPDVIADKVTGALDDADRFGFPNVKPPLSQALDEVRRAGGVASASVEAEREQPTQDALTGQPAEVDEKAGSAELLKPATQPPT